MTGISQVILVDDASSDDTVEVAARLGITVIRHEVNRGMGPIRRLAMAQS